MSPAAVVATPDVVRADSFRGYGLLGQAFASGHVLSFRRFDWSSIGPPFTTVWHRRPSGEWTFFSNIEPGRSVVRYLGAMDDAVQRDGIDIEWRGRHELSVHVHSARLQLALRLTTTPLARAVGAFATFMPGAVWRTQNGPRWIGRLTGRVLSAGPLDLTGRTPSGHQLLLRPQELWHVTAAAAVLDGRELGAAITLEETVTIGGLRVPRSGLLFRGSLTATL